MRINFGNRLSVHSWAQLEMDLATQAFASRYRDADEDLEIDLSAVGFADFIVLGRLLVLVDAVAAAGSAVNIQLPSRLPLGRELTYLRAADNEAAHFQLANRLALRRRQRINCRLFMEQAGFESALNTGNWAANCVKITEFGAGVGYQPGFDEIDADLFETIKVPQRNRRFLPYRWLQTEVTPVEARIETDQIERALDVLGLAREDSASVAHGIISELVENVRCHASADGRASTPLLGLTVVEARSYALRSKDFEPYLTDFAGWASQLGTPILRLLVGDSGQGIKTSYVQGEQRVRLSEPDVDQDAIFAALSRRRDLRVEGTGPQGLWKVQQILRTYTGSLAIRSGNATAGHVFVGMEKSKDIRASSDVWLPGTIAECNILTHRQSHMPHRDAELESPVPSMSASSPRPLICIAASLRPLHGLDQADLGKIRDALHEAHIRHHGLVIILEIPAETNTLEANEFQAFIGDVLHATGEFEEPPALAIAFAGANRNFLALAIQDLNLRHDISSLANDEPQTPVLVLSERVHYWAGGSAPLRHLYGRLSQSRSPLSVDDLAEDERSQLSSQLARQNSFRQLIKTEGNAVYLTLRPQDALAAMAKFIGTNTATAIYSEEAIGVERGLFLAPSTRLTYRWIDVAELLHGLGYMNSASLALAFLVEQRIGYLLSSARPLTVHAYGPVAGDIVKSFSSSLGGTVGRQLTAASDLIHSTRTSSSDNYRSAIIFIDLISSEHSLKAALADVARMGTMVVAVAAFIDTRDASPADDEDHIRVGERLVPLVRLTKVSIEVKPTEQDAVTVIDPALGRPLARRPVYARSMALQEKYVEAVVRSGGARLGHIATTAERHYSVYVDPDFVYGDALWTETAISAIVNRLQATRDSAELSEQEGICVVYPAPVEVNVGKFIVALRAALRDARLPVAGAVQIPRVFAGGNWRYPASIRLPETAGHVLAFDASSRTGNTARQLIRLSSEPTIRAITVVVLANGMEESEAIALQQLRVIEPTGPRRTTKHLIPVDVSYLTRTAVMAASPLLCSLCELRSSYSLSTYHLPPLLAEQQRFLLSALNVRSKEDIFAHQAFDLFGVPIEQADCIAYLRLCAHLRDARFSTTERAILVRDVRRLAAELAAKRRNAKVDSARDALIRVLAADHRWIEREPLAFDSIRPLVADIAESLLLSSPTSIADPMLRIQAVIVLVSADCYRFVASVANILRACSDHHLVCAHVLLEAMKLIDEPRQDIALIQRLAENLTGLEHNPTSGFSADLAPTGRDATMEIKYVAALARTRLPVSAATRQAAWNALASHVLSVRDHSYDQPMWRLLVTIDNLRNGLSIDDSDETLDDWLSCSDGLSSNVFPYTKVLSKYFTSARVTRHFSYWDRSRWENVVTGSGPRLVSDMTARLIPILRRPTATIAGVSAPWTYGVSLTAQIWKGM